VEFKPASGATKLLNDKAFYGGKLPEEYWEEKTFGGNSSVKSVNDFYKENSNNQLQFVRESLPKSSNTTGVYKVTLSTPHPNSSPLNGEPNRILDHGVALLALKQLQDRYNFSFNDKYTTTNDRSAANYLHILFIVAGYDASENPFDEGFRIWPHRGGAIDNSGTLGKTGKTYYYTMISEMQGHDYYYDKYFGGYIAFGNLHPSTIGGMCHELGHSLGAPDLYHIKNTSTPYQSGRYDDENSPEYYSVMASGDWGSVNSTKNVEGDSPTHFDPWNKIKLGWYTATTTRPPRLYQANNSSQYKIFKIPSPDPSQYYLIENRQFYGFDKGFDGYVGALKGVTAGIVVWRVDEWVIGEKSNSSINNQSRHGVTVVSRPFSTDWDYGYGLGEQFLLTHHTGDRSNSSWLTDASKEANPCKYEVVSGSTGGFAVQRQGAITGVTNVTGSSVTLNWSAAALDDSIYTYKFYASTSQLLLTIIPSLSNSNVTYLGSVSGNGSQNRTFVVSKSAFPALGSGVVYFNVLVEGPALRPMAYPPGTTGGKALYEPYKYGSSSTPNPPIYTKPATNIAANTGTLNASFTINNTGTPIEYGFYYGSEGGDITKIIVGYYDPVNTPAMEEEGTNSADVLDFSYELSGLDPNTIYNFTAYAGTYEADPMSFTTEAVDSDFGFWAETFPATDIIGGSATLNGWVTNTNGDLIESGFYWGTTSSPTTKFSFIPTWFNGWSLSYDLSHLTGDTTYYFQAFAGSGDNEVRGEILEFKTGLTPPSIVEDLVITPGNDTLKMNWAAPSSDGGSEILGYEVSIDDGVTWDAAVNNTNHTFFGLTNGVIYPVKIRAFNILGSGPVFTRYFWLPLVHTNGATDITVDSAILHAVYFGNSDSDSFGFYLGTSDDPTTKVQITAIGNHAFSSRLSDLTADTTYYYQAFWGSDTDEVRGNIMNFTTDGINTNFEGALPIEANIPVPVEIIAASQTRYFKFIPTASVTYTIESTKEGNDSADPYCYLYDADQTRIASDHGSTGNGNFRLIRNLTEGEIYYIGINCYGSGTGSYSFSVTAITAPSAPQNFTATPGSGQVTLSWTAPLSDGGGAITHYHVSKDDGANWFYTGSDTEHTFTGLTNGIAYTFKVRAANFIGFEGAEAKATATPLHLLYIPLADWDTSALGGTLSMPIFANTTWEAVSNSESWLSVEPSAGVNDGSIKLTVAFNTSSSQRAGTIIITGGGVVETITVIQSGGAAIISAPQTLVAAPGDGQVMLNWTAPLSDGGIPITHYQVSKDGGATWFYAGSNSEHTFTGLTNGTTYTFKVRASNAIGICGAEATITATPLNILYTTLTSWNPSELGGTLTVPIYANTTWSASSSSASWLSVAPSSGVNNGIITLTATVNTTASQRNGTIVIAGGGAEETIIVNQFGTAPSEPQDFTATPGNEQVELQWDASLSNGGLAITHYQVSKDGGLTWLYAGSDIGHTFTGLTNGITYTFKVRALNLIGIYGAEATITATPQPIIYTTLSGWNPSTLGGTLTIPIYANTTWAASSSSTSWLSVTPSSGINNGIITLTATVNTTASQRNGTIVITGGGAEETIIVNQFGTAPSEPQSFTATPGSEQVELGWDAPLSDDGLAITYYQVSKDDGINWVYAESDTGHTFTGLTNGITYTFKVRALNFIGICGAEATITATPLNILSTTLTQWNLSALGGTLTIPISANTTWSASSSSTSWLNVAPSNGVNNGIITLTATPNTTASQRIGTINITGGGLVETITVTQLETAPSEPQSFTAIPGSGQVVLNWDAPLSDDGIAITHYQVSKDDGINWSYAGSDTGHTFSGLTNGIIYTFKVRALNSIGIYGAEATITATPLTILSTTLTEWNPSSFGGTLTIPVSANTTWAASCSSTSWLNVAPSSGVNNGIITLTAVSNTTALQRIGTIIISGGGSTITILVSQWGSAPSTPQSFTATPGNEQVELSWAAPLNDGGAQITHYQVSKDDGITWFYAESDTGHTFTGLTNGMTYTFKVRAANSISIFGAEATITATPLAVLYTTLNQWNTSSPGGTLSVPIYANTTWAASSSATSWLNVEPSTGVNNGFITLTAMPNTTTSQRIGTIIISGGGSTVTIIVTQWGSAAPSEPQNFTATPGNHQVKLSWAAPLSNGGISITHYHVSQDDGATWFYAMSSTGHTFTGLTNGTTYTFKVRAANAIGTTGAEATVTATPVYSVGVSGKISSYYPNNPTTIRLIQNEEVIYETTISSTDGYGKKDQEFSFEYVVPGTYSLVVTKAVHPKFTVQTVVVGNEDLDLTKDSRPEVQLMALRCGDISNDGLINDADLTILWRSGNYNRHVSQADNPLCDLNGDSLINDGDLTILWLAYNYNRGLVIIP
jgi:M6 family metalloprotease-like protein